MFKGSHSNGSFDSNRDSRQLVEKLLIILFSNVYGWLRTFEIALIHPNIYSNMPFDAEWAETKTINKNNSPSFQCKWESISFHKLESKPPDSMILWELKYCMFSLRSEGFLNCNVMEGMTITILNSWRHNLPYEFRCSLFYKLCRMTQFWCYLEWQWELPWMKVFFLE